jgi:hypothetical protein
MSTRFRTGSFSGLSSRIQDLAHICHVDRHGHITLKQSRLLVLNETHTNSYTGSRLSVENQVSDSILGLNYRVYQKKGDL